MNSEDALWYLKIIFTLLIFFEMNCKIILINSNKLKEQMIFPFSKLAGQMNHKMLNVLKRNLGSF